MIFSKSWKATWKLLNPILIIIGNFKYILFWKNNIFKQIYDVSFILATMETEFFIERNYSKPLARDKIVNDFILSKIVFNFFFYKTITLLSSKNMFSSRILKKKTDHWTNYIWKMIYKTFSHRSKEIKKWHGTRKQNARDPR